MFPLLSSTPNAQPQAQTTQLPAQHAEIAAGTQLQSYTVMLGSQKLLRAREGLEKRIHQCLQQVGLGKFCGLTRSIWQFSKHICCCCLELKREKCSEDVERQICPENKVWGKSCSSPQTGAKNSTDRSGGSTEEMKQRKQ